MATKDKAVPFTTRTLPKIEKGLTTWVEATLEEFDSATLGLKRYLAGLRTLAGSETAGLEVTFDRDEIEELFNVAHGKVEKLSALIDERTTDFQEKFDMDDMRGAR